MDNEFRNYVRLIESAHDTVDSDDEIIDEECTCDDESHEDQINEIEHNDSNEIIDEDSGFWENFEKDSDFELNENNGMYCVRGVDTSFHYGSHVDYDCAADHIESLRNYQS